MTFLFLLQVVSGLGREIPSPAGVAIPGAIQTDAAINAGKFWAPKLNPSFETSPFSILSLWDVLTFILWVPWVARREFLFVANLSQIATKEK